MLSTSSMPLSLNGGQERHCRYAIAALHRDTACGVSSLTHVLIKVWRVQGTFLVRPSLSLAGAMVLSVVVSGVVKHMALDGNQLDTRSLEVLPQPHPMESSAG